MPELFLADALGATGKPLLRVHTAGSVGGSTAVVASHLITSGLHDRVLVVAFEKVIRGGRYISETLAERLADGELGAPHERLSDREFDVMRGIAGGETVSEIALRMHLSVKTVSTYRTRLLEKMKMETNAELTRYAIDNQLV